METNSDIAEHGYGEAAGMSCLEPGPGDTSASEGTSGSVDDGLMSRQQRLIPFVISVQALLSQFSHPKVRADFINNKFGIHINAMLLPKIDLLRWRLFPVWQGNRGFEEANNNNTMAAKDLQSLLSKSKSLFQLGGDAIDDSLSYRDWFRTLESIALSNYWSKVSMKERCTNILRSDSETSKKSVTARKRGGKTSSSVASLCSRKESLEVKRERAQIDKSGGRSIIDIVISSDSHSETTSQASSSSSSSDEACSSNTRTKSANKKKRRSKCQQRYNDHREVVTPPIFDLKGKPTLKEFFDVFENYFNRKFNGTEYDQTQELSKFMKGELLQVYNIQGGRTLKYQTMKKVLLNWYRKQKVGGRGYWKEQLEGATPESGEAYDIFGMRLAEFANRAYTKSTTESAKQLRKRFLETLDPRISAKILDAERSLKINPLVKKSHMSFSSMMELARQLQREAATTAGPQSQSVFWSAPMQQPDVRPRSRSTEPQVGRQSSQLPGNVTFTNSRRNIDVPRQWRGGPGDTCDFCGKSGHSRAECWRASKSCLICGRDHHITACSRYNPNFRSGANRYRQNDYQQDLN